MFRSIQGVYRHGEIHLVERPDDLGDDVPVIVTFLEPGVVDLRQYGIDLEAAAQLRERLAPFASDWDAPEMEIYDDYERVKGGD